MKNISYGEELTFDYCSYTEDIHECEKAVCLCGSKNCRGSYLDFSESKNNLKNFEKLSPFLKRQALVFQACFQGNLSISQEKTLQKYCFRENIRKNCKNWLEIWIAAVLEIVEQEESLIKNAKMEENLVLSANIRENRLQNLAISVDKIKHFLSKTSKNAEKQPWTRLSSRDIFRYLWGNPRNLRDFPKKSCSEPRSVAEELIKVLKSCENAQPVCRILSFLWKLNRFLQKIWRNDIKTAIILTKLGFLRISALLQTLAEKNQGNCLGDEKNGCHFFAIADILYFYSFTLNFLKKTQYSSVLSSVVNIRKCEVSNQETYEKKLQNNVENDGKIEFSGEKLYESDFVWEQLSNWFKQTGNSLKNQAKGTLVYPNLAESFSCEQRFGYSFHNSAKVIRFLRDFKEF